MNIRENLYWLHMRLEHLAFQNKIVLQFSAKIALPENVPKVFFFSSSDDFLAFS